jgi:hypothetical protein
MNCPNAREINLFADGELTPPRQAALAGHIPNCSSCRQTLAGIQHVKEKIASGLDIIAPVSIPQFRTRSSDTKKPGWGFRPLPILAMTCFTLALLGLVWIFIPANAHGPKRPQGPSKTEILDISIQGERADTMIFNDPDTKTMFVWAIARAPQ